MQEDDRRPCPRNCDVQIKAITVDPLMANGHTVDDFVVGPAYGRLGCHASGPSSDTKTTKATKAMKTNEERLLSSAPSTRGLRPACGAR